MKGLIDMPGPPRSSPGQPPHVDSGELLASIDYAVDKTNHSVTVGSTSGHALPLEEGTHVMAPRPFLVRTMVDAGDDAARRILKV